MRLSAGTRLGPYEIVALIGAGGMGDVYRARDSRLGRDVAIKVLPIAFSADADRLHRFEQEARAAAALNHPNILAVYDIGTQADAPFIVSELLEGETLRERLNAGPVAARKAIEQALQIAHGLAAAHDKGIIHRDLKPENVFITRDNRIKILDFGLAKLTQRHPRPTRRAGVPRCRRRPSQEWSSARSATWRPNRSVDSTSTIARICSPSAPSCTSSCRAAARFAATRRPRRWRRSSTRIRRISARPRRRFRRRSRASSNAAWRRIRRRAFRRPAISRSL